MSRTFDPDGKAALFSSAPRRAGRFKIQCSSCHDESHVGMSRMVKLAFPINFTLPFKYHHTWLRCPSCGQRTWVRIRTSDKGRE